MSAKSKRPNVLDIDSLIVRPRPEAVHEDTTDSSEKAAAALASRKPPKPEVGMFRTSVYFSRTVHDKLRAIAFEERKTVTDLINEGLDHVLASRNYPTTAELRKEKA
jgi:hypothetical protein